MALGLDPALFWGLTPRELSVHLAGAQLRQEREHNTAAWAAWHVAALQRTKKLPKLKTMLVAERKVRTRQTWQEQYAMALKWHAFANRTQGKLDG